MLRRKSEWQELRRCQPDGWNGIPPARYGWPGIGHVPLRTGRNALPQAARMLPQVRAARRTFFMENRPGSNRRLRHPVRRYAAAQQRGSGRNRETRPRPRQGDGLAGAAAHRRERRRGRIRRRRRHGVPRRVGHGRRDVRATVAARAACRGLCVQQGELLHCSDSETGPRVDRDACRRVGLRSMLVMPLTHVGTTIGVLKVMSPADSGTLRLMADLIAAAMFHAARNEATERYLRATHDALTGRRAVRIRRACAAARRQGRHRDAAGRRYRRECADRACGPGDVRAKRTRTQRTARASRVTRRMRR